MLKRRRKSSHVSAQYLKPLESNVEFDMTNLTIFQAAPTVAKLLTPDRNEAVIEVKESVQKEPSEGQ